MKQQIRICLFGAGILTVLIIFIVLGVKVFGLTKEKGPQASIPKETEEEHKELQEETYKYEIRMIEENLCVYKVLTGELFLETSIKLHELPEEVKTRLKQGIRFKTDKEMYDFLESYSS